jgi:hypothetical protein
MKTPLRKKSFQDYYDLRLDNHNHPLIMLIAVTSVRKNHIKRSSHPFKEHTDSYTFLDLQVWLTLISLFEYGMTFPLVKLYYTAIEFSCHVLDRNIPHTFY